MNNTTTMTGRVQIYYTSGGSATANGSNIGLFLSPFGAVNTAYNGLQILWLEGIAFRWPAAVVS